MNALTGIERVARALVPDRRRTTALDAEALLRRWGARITTEWDAAHGQTTWTDAGPLIRTSPSRTPGRRSSTLAHEFGHLTIDPFRRDAGSSGNRVPDAHRQRLHQILDAEMQTVQQLLREHPIEQICDQLAWELLLPRRWAASLVTEVDGFADVRSAASLFGISLSFLILRMNEHHADFMLLRLLPARGGEWIVADTAAAAPNWLEGAVVDYPSSRRLTDLRRRQTPHPTCLRNAEDGDYFDCEVTIGRYGAYALGRLPAPTSGMTTASTTPETWY